ncbi:YeiH family protein [Parvibaculum sp.]|jgi:uncharacterized integral membrane protein (TIGR00698 family)|uniref:YeiH family protein n=1 Tax=Parvibaculum sp. TaxID=2024848 RepID=UPI002FD9F25C
MTPPERGVPRSLKQLESLESMEGIVQAEHSAPSSRSLLHRLPKGALVHAVYPGVLVAVTIALASSWLSQHYGAPVMLFALLFGMAFHFLHEEGRCVAGIEFSSRTILRIGVALLGVRITAGEIASLGVVPVLTVVAGVATTILAGILLSRLLGLSRIFGVLSGGAVAICGASAALAIASVLPRRDENERDTILTVVAITALSTLAMVLYPVFVGMIGLDHTQAGIFLGGTIHDVAQVVGAGYMVSVETGDVATYVKLLRVAMLLPVVFCIAFVVSRSGGARASGGTRLVPLFLVGFAALVAVNSLGLLTAPVVDAATDVSRWCLVTAIAALGMKTSFRDLASAGWRPVGLMVAETIWIAGLVLVSLEFLA